jgi:hypothetical protein
MKPLFATLAGAALLALATPVSAQTLAGSDSSNQLSSAALPPWMQDDGSSSDHPVHMPGDVSGQALNSQYRRGIDVLPPNGFPAPYVIQR